jgi:penicillin-binding protein 1A
MQLVRTVTAKRQRRIDRKLKEIILARKPGLVATSATQATDLVRLAFKPGTVPKVASTGEIIQAAREARERAHSQAVEERAWGSRVTESIPGEGKLLENN